MELLKRARQIERDRTLKQGLPPHPNLRLVTYQRWERRREVQRQMVLRTMAQAAVRATDLVRQAVNLPPISLAGPEGHWQVRARARGRGRGRGRVRVRVALLTLTLALTVTLTR